LLASDSTVATNDDSDVKPATFKDEQWLANNYFNVGSNHPIHLSGQFLERAHAAKQSNVSTTPTCSTFLHCGSFILICNHFSNPTLG